MSIKEYSWTSTSSQKASRRIPRGSRTKDLQQRTSRQILNKISSSETRGPNPGEARKSSYLVSTLTSSSFSWILLL